jgi:hypothetical protein
MMQFREIKEALRDLLGEESAGRFSVIGFQRQNKNAKELIGNNRLVQVYYSDGNFPPSGTRMRTPKTHDMNFNIDLSASAQAQGDLSILLSETATAIQRAAALAAIKEAAEIADEQIDELIDIVYQILMDARNEKLGFPKGEISNRKIDRMTKDVILENGSLVVKTATMVYTCRAQEIVSGAVGVEPETVTFDANTSIDDSSSTGVIIQNDNT